MLYHDEFWRFSTFFSFFMGSLSAIVVGRVGNLGRCLRSRTSHKISRRQTGTTVDVDARLHWSSVSVMRCSLPLRLQRRPFGQARVSDDMTAMISFYSSQIKNYCICSVRAISFQLYSLPILDLITIPFDQKINRQPWAYRL